MYKLNYFNFKENENSYLITNDLGKYMFISKDDFADMVRKKKLNLDLSKNLIEKGFIFEENEEDNYMFGDDEEEEFFFDNESR